MPRKLVFCFDGTSNQPGDTFEERGLLTAADSSITNVLKLHLLFGGDLDDGQQFGGQHSFYYSGVGTRGSGVRRFFNAALGLPSTSINIIINEAQQDFEAQGPAPDDEVFLFGFSRGAAIARRFASDLAKHGVPVRFIGVFDTVASIGLPRITEEGNPSSEVVFEHGTIASQVREALHLVSIDETRRAFRPVLMNRDDRVTEVWFPGVHADVGGGYRVDGLSDSALEFMLEEIERRQLGLEVLPVSAIPFEALSPDGGEYDGYTIEVDDVVIEPDRLATLHTHERAQIVADRTLDDRHVCVHVDDTPSEHRPLVHWSAADRIYRQPDSYAPAALDIPHDVLLPDGQTVAADGIEEHRQRCVIPLAPLKAGERCELVCNSHRLLNHSGILLEEGEKYIFHVPEGQKWDETFDHSLLGGEWYTESGPEGWAQTDLDLRLHERIGLRVLERGRRLRNANWLALIGSVGSDDTELFEILEYTQRPYIPQSSGEFCTFANDRKTLYSNNNGRISFVIEHVG